MSVGKTRWELPTKVSMPKPCAHARTASGPHTFNQAPTSADCGPKRSMNASSASAWVMFSPPLPASKNLRPTEGMASNTCTDTPAADKTSAAIKPAGPAPITATSTFRVLCTLMVVRPEPALPTTTLVG